MSRRVANRFAERGVVQPQFRQRLAGMELKIVSDKIAFCGCGARRLLGGSRHGRANHDRERRAGKLFKELDHLSPLRREKSITNQGAEPCMNSRHGLLCCRGPVNRLERTTKSLAGEVVRCEALFCAVCCFCSGRLPPGARRSRNFRPRSAFSSRKTRRSWRWHTCALWMALAPLPAEIKRWSSQTEKLSRSGIPPRQKLRTARKCWISPAGP